MKPRVKPISSSRLLLLHADLPWHTEALGFEGRAERWRGQGSTLWPDFTQLVPSSPIPGGTKGGIVPKRGAGADGTQDLQEQVPASSWKAV